MARTRRGLDADWEPNPKRGITACLVVGSPASSGLLGGVPPRSPSPVGTITFDTGPGTIFPTSPHSGNPTQKLSFARAEGPSSPPVSSTYNNNSHCRTPAWAYAHCQSGSCSRAGGEPAEAAPRAALKSHRYQMARTWFNHQLHRDFPRYKTMLQGWDGQMQAETAQMLILCVCQHYTSRNVCH